MNPWHHFWHEVVEFLGFTRCRRHHLRRISVTIKNLSAGGGERMGNPVNAKLGDVVVVQLDGHSANNGAVIPEGTTIGLASNDLTVATVPASVTVPAGGAQTIPDIPVTLLAPGSTDITMHAVTPDGTAYDAAGTLVVSSPVPGLVSISLTIINKSTTPAV